MQERLDAHAAEVLGSGVATAAAVAVTDAERTLIARSYGAAEDALWPIASVGKAFAGVIALQLAEEGALDLHAPVEESLPWFSVRSRFAPITLHHLLTHTSGLIASSDRAPASSYDVLALAETETGFAPGEHRHYSNVGYRAVGTAFEAVTGEPYGDLVQRRVLDRLDLRDSVPTMTHAGRTRVPPGHVPRFDDRPWRPEHGLVPAPWVESAEADGCSCCTVEELAAFLRSLWREDEALLSPASFGAMKTPWPPDEGFAYGYGLELGPHGFGHGGDMLGHVSHVRVDLESGVGVAACANGFAGAWWLGEGALAIHAGGSPPAVELDAGDPLVDDGSGSDELRRCVGRFRAHNPWLPTFAVAARDGAAVYGADWLSGSEREPLAELEPGLFRLGEKPWTPERVRFDTAVGGGAYWRAILSGTPYYRAFTGV
jgi:CubicO group peptidase (beta-lactamase class C family)